MDEQSLIKALENMLEKEGRRGYHEHDGYPSHPVFVKHHQEYFSSARARTPPIADTTTPQKIGSTKMMYVSTNFKNKKALIDAVKTGEDIAVYEYGTNIRQTNGVVGIAGPRFQHTWNATVVIEDGRVIEVR